MNIKKKLFAFFIFLSILTLSILSIKNPEKTKFYFFTSKIEEISLGNLISITFISGFAFSSLLGIIYKNNSKEILKDNYNNDEDNDEDIDKFDDKEFSQDLETKRPPERDVRESQPTISVNYRFVDQDNNSYSSRNTKKTNNNSYKEEDDWENYDNEW